MSTATYKCPRVLYDRDADVLYVSLGRPRPHVSREDPEIEGLYYSFDVDSSQLCGLTIVWYSSQDKRLLSQRIPFPIALP